MSKKTNISADIIEKDYYVCAVLKEFENIQNKYVLNNKYKVSIAEVKNILKQIYNKVCK